MSFNLSDEKIRRLASFRMPNARTGLEIASLGLRPDDPQMMIKLAEIAASHLILEADAGTNMPRQEIVSFDELTYIFNDPFIGITLVKEFEAFIAPLLKRLKM